MRAACWMVCLLAATLLAQAPPTIYRHPDIVKERPTAEPSAPVGHVVIIDLQGDVTFGLAASVKRRTEEALALSPEPGLLVYRIDTYGGTADSALKIADVIAGVDEPTTVAYVPRKAISAGALIAMSCREMVMGEGSKIGDCQPIIPTPEGMTRAGEKAESMLRATFRSYARRNGYPEGLAEAMVSAHIEVHRVTIEGQEEPLYVRAEEVPGLRRLHGEQAVSSEVVLAEGELLTMHDEETFEYGFSRAIVTSEAGFLAHYGASGAQVTTLGTSWSEELVRFFDLVGPLLLAVGLLGLYLEFKTPGLGLPGIVGVTCLALYFGSKYLVGLADTVDILLFLVGVLLLAVELFVIPGFGIVGVAGLLLILTGLFLSFQPFVIPHSPAEAQMLGWSFFQLLVAMGIVLTAALILGRYLPSVPLMRGLVLTTEFKTRRMYSSAAPSGRRLRKFVGTRGITTTDCRPAGKAVFGEELVDVVAQGEYIERGREVEVVDLEGNRVVVRATGPPPTEEEEA